MSHEVPYFIFPVGFPVGPVRYQVTNCTLRIKIGSNKLP